MLPKSSHSLVRPGVVTHLVGVGPLLSLSSLSLSLSGNIKAASYGGQNWPCFPDHLLPTPRGRHSIPASTCVCAYRVRTKGGRTTARRPRSIRLISMYAICVHDAATSFSPLFLVGMHVSIRNCNWSPGLGAKGEMSISLC